MLRKVAHIGITVSSIERSIEFYRDVLGLTLTSRLTMVGESTDLLFDKKNAKVNLAYLRDDRWDKNSPVVELIEFEGEDVDTHRSDFSHTSISELCFEVDNIDEIYEKLVAKGVECISRPQRFSFLEEGFGESKAIYFKDPDGIILELIEML